VTDVRALLCACGVAAVLLTVGCSSSSAPETTVVSVTTETTSVTSTPTAAPGSYAACLAEEGIDATVDPTLGPPPGPAPPPPGVDESAWQQAVLTCTDLVAGPAGG
jgi:hypothetical protein